MGIFGGPSKQQLMQAAQGVASFALQHKQLKDLNGEAKREIINNMVQEGSPTNSKELAEMVTDFIKEEKLGWNKRSQFLTMIYGCLTSAGMSNKDAFNVRENLRIHYDCYGK